VSAGDLAGVNGKYQSVAGAGGQAMSQENVDQA
jgi:hypothetical protein